MKKSKTKARKTRVFCAGTFDGLHPGHLNFLQFAKKFGGELWVVVARDQSVLKTKGRTPLFGEKQRLELVGALAIVGKALLGVKGNWFKSVKKVDPTVIVLGHDQKIGEKKLLEFIWQNKLKTKIVRAPAFDRNKNRSSKLKARKHFGKKI